jgi:hypothetical protein
VAIKLCESQNLFVADIFFIFSLLGSHFIDSYLDKESFLPLEFRHYVVLRFLHRWGELLKVEYGMVVLCYVLHPAYKMKGIVQEFVDSDVMLESIEEDNGVYIIIKRLTKSIASYGKRIGLSAEVVINLIHELRRSALMVNIQLHMIVFSA